MQEVVKKEIVKLLDTDIIYPISDSPWFSLFCSRSLEKGWFGAFIDDGEETGPMKKVNTNYGPLALFVMEDEDAFFVDDLLRPKDSDGSKN
ncbi:hypothetical protein Tco_0452716 [Tanacetum coccineum]